MRAQVSRLGGAVLLAALAVGLAGCTGAPASSEPTAAPAAFPEIPQGVGVVSGATMSRCDVNAGAVTAEGTFTLPEGSAESVVISVSWVDPDTSVVYARGVTELTDPVAGDEQSWTTASTLPVVDSAITCVLGAVIPE